MGKIHQVGNGIETQSEILPEGNHGTKIMGEGDRLQILIHKNLEEVQKDPFQEKTIFRVPACFHEKHKELFEPKMVSIGPYHHGKESLRFMEQQKWSFLREFLAAGPVGIEVYLQELRALEGRARRCYSEGINMSSDDFVMMLLLDGCFLLEHINRLSAGRFDALCNLGWGINNLMTDVVLLENQIPFFVIHRLFSIRGGQTDNCEGPCVLLNLFFKHPGCIFYNTISASGKPPSVSCDNISHFLHLFHTCIVQDDTFTIQIYQEEQRNQETDAAPQSNTALIGNHSPEINEEPQTELREVFTSPVGIPCASVLHEAGVEFKKKENPSNMFDITFENGTMEMPFLSINCVKKIIFSNVAAFEQSQIHKLRFPLFSGFLSLMDALVNSEKDVTLLEQCDILENMLPSEKDAAAFFNDMGDLFVSQKYVGHPLFPKLKKYSDSTWHKMRANLMHNYCNSPWSAISVFAASILLILTFLQTYFSAK